MCGSGAMMKIFYMALLWWANISGWLAVVVIFFAHLFHNVCVNGGQNTVNSLCVENGAALRHIDAGKKLLLRNTTELNSEDRL